MPKITIDFTRPVPPDLVSTEDQVLRFARWARASGAKPNTDTSGLDRRYDVSQDAEWLAVPSCVCVPKRPAKPPTARPRPSHGPRVR